MSEKQQHEEAFERFLELLSQKLLVDWPGTNGETIRGIRVYLKHSRRVASTHAPPATSNNEPEQRGISTLLRRK